MSSAVDNLADNLATASIGAMDASAANNDAVLASAAEGRRLYIGNLAYATTEAELKQFFSGYDVYVHWTFYSHPPTTDMFLKNQRVNFHPCQPTHQPPCRLCLCRFEDCR